AKRSNRRSRPGSWRRCIPHRCCVSRTKHRASASTIFLSKICGLLSALSRRWSLEFVRLIFFARHRARRPALEDERFDPVICFSFLAAFDRTEMGGTGVAQESPNPFLVFA